MKTKSSNTKVVRLAANKLAVHPHAQRELIPGHLAKIRANLDLDAIGVFHAVEYEINGVTKIWIVDGQHRWNVLMEEGLGEWVVEVSIHVDVKTDARASELFLRLNYRKPVVAYHRFINEARAQHPTALGVLRLTEERKLRIAAATDNGTLSCVVALARLYEVDEGKTLAATLDTVIAAWGHVAAATEGKLIEGLGKVYTVYNGAIDRPALVKKLAKYPGGPSTLIGDARGLRQYRHVSVTRCIAERIIETYNSGRQNKLEPL
jgi:hypothetical protein